MRIGFRGMARDDRVFPGPGRLCVTGFLGRLLAVDEPVASSASNGECLIGG
jgi:hypothetical protein